MNDYGQSGSRFATVLHILRVAACAKIHWMPPSPDPFSESMGIVEFSRNCSVVNLLSPMISAMRRMKNRKPKELTSRCNPITGAIIVGNFEFAKSVWGKLIPRFHEWAELLFGRLLEGNCWRNMKNMIKSDRGALSAKESSKTLLTTRRSSEKFTLLVLS